MKVLILGAGGREHALAALFSQSKKVSKIFCAGGNAGMAALGECFPDVDPCDGPAVAGLARRLACDLVFVGPEAPAAAGTVDALQQAGIPVIGPNQASARLESSKVFSKRFYLKYHIPTAEAEEFDSFPAFQDYIIARPGKKLVIKKNGLAAGKGVLESADREELLAFGQDVLGNDTLLVEEFLTGWETSIFALSDGRTHRVLLPCTDHKKAHDGDTGPNTGGMGAICPVPRVDDELQKVINTTIVEPTFRGLEAEGLSYRGVVYFGLMVTDQGPKILEYNVRFGDPEAQVLLPLIKTDFGDIAHALVTGTLARVPVEFHDQAALGVVVAARGYPGSYKKGLPVAPITQPPAREAVIYHASTRLEQGRVLTGGGRCFTVTGFGPDLKTAAASAYRHIDGIQFEGAWYRRDIGKNFYS
jgi:phosphoribosylamine--glycine ligase